MLNVLVINLGLKSIRAIVFSPAGRQLFCASRPVHTSIIGDQAEQDALEWAVLLRECLDAVRQGSTLAQTIGHVTVTTSSSCPLGLDAALQPVTPVYMVSDSRARIEAERLSRVSELPIAASSPVAKYAWLAANDPDTAGKVKFWVNAGDYLVALLTGELVTDPLNGGKCLYDGATYNHPVLREASLDSALLPRVCPSGTAIPTRREPHLSGGLPEKCRLVLSSYDAICAVLGGGGGDSGNACDVSGTVTSVRMLTASDAPVKPPLLSQPLGSEGLRVVGCSNNLGGGIVEWYKQFVRIDAGGDVYAQMDAEARLTPPGAHGVIFLPYLMGERAPFYLPQARGCFFGLGRETGHSEMTRAVLESTAFVTRDLVEALRDQKMPVESITVSGGLARVDLVNQIKADVLSLPVRVPENFESTAVGAFIMTAVAAGYYPDLRAAVATVVRFRQIIQPSADNHEVYAKSFELFRQINRVLTPVYSRHAELRQLGAGYSRATLSNL